MRQTRSQVRGQEARGGHSSEQPIEAAVIPLKARPGLLVVLSVVFAAWIGFLLVLYFTTVRHG